MLTSTIMKLRKLAILFSAVAASLLMSACSSLNDEEVVAGNGFNFFGVVSHEPGSFAPAGEYSSVVRTHDIYGMELPTGDRTSLLWGAIVIQDY